MKSLSNTIADLAMREDYNGVVTELRRSGHLPGMALEKGWVVAIRIPADAMLAIGRVDYLVGKYLWLDDASWIDHTGELYADALQKGAVAKGWSSEYEGRVCIVLGSGIKIQLLPDSFSLPKTSVRPG